MTDPIYTFMNHRHKEAPRFPGVYFTSTPDNILTKPRAAFPQNNHRDNGKR